MSFLDSMFGLRSVLSSGIEVVTRKALNFGADFTLTDDPTNGRTNISLATAAAGLKYKGDWDDGTDYATSDVVKHAGSTWLSLESSTDVEPTVDADEWTLFGASAAADENTVLGNKGAGTESLDGADLVSLFAFVTSSALSSALSSYATIAGVMSTLAGYVTSGALTSALAGYIAKSLITAADQVLVGTASATPGVVTLAAKRLLGKGASGALAALTGAQAALIIDEVTSFAWSSNAASLDLSAGKNFAASNALAGNSTLTLANGAEGNNGVIMVLQDSTPGRTIAFSVSGRTTWLDLNVPDTNPRATANSTTLYQYLFITVGGTAYVVINKIFGG